MYYDVSTCQVGSVSLTPASRLLLALRDRDQFTPTAAAAAAAAASARPSLKVRLLVHYHFASIHGVK